METEELIRTNIQNGIKSKHRSMFVIVGDKNTNLIIKLHDMLSNSVVAGYSKPRIVWFYKDKLDLSSFDELTACRYTDCETVLNNTYGMCILQDFQALTPNLIVRAINTLEGGGLLILLLPSVSSLTSLYTMDMVVHETFCTESHPKATGRFNERLILSLASCKACMVVDAEHNILPISSHMKGITPVTVQGLPESDRDRKSTQEQSNVDFPAAGLLINMCRTVDQEIAVKSSLDAISDTKCLSTVALVAARGRGKSAALGLAIAGAVYKKYSNVYVTAPSPENLQTLFEFVLKGFEMLGYKVDSDYDVVKSSSPDLNKATIQINIHKQERREPEAQLNIYRIQHGIIKYIQPQELKEHLLVDLMVVDEADAFSWPVVKSLLGPYLVLISSTVSSSEGTGSSASSELLQQLEGHSRTIESFRGNVSYRLFKKIEMHESIRYASDDPIESWLNSLLCLDVSRSVTKIERLPDPSKCNLHYVNRDTLFSYHKDNELFLQRMMALYDKKSPNDLQLLADAPAYHFFVLLGPMDASKNLLHDILCVVQVCFEGQISPSSVKKRLTTYGHQAHGDIIPWKFCEEFWEPVFPTLLGARIVQIVTHPTAKMHGYDSKAVEILSRYFEGQFSEAEVDYMVESPAIGTLEAGEKVSLLEEIIKPRPGLPQLLVNLHERKPEKLHYIGVSFGLTLENLRFWKKHEFVPFYVDNRPSTGERTCMALKLLNNDLENKQDLGPYFRGFRERFRRLLGSVFKEMHYNLAMSVLDPKITFAETESALPTCQIEETVLWEEMSKSWELLPNEWMRLEAYSYSGSDYELILGLLSPLSHFYFDEKLPVSLTYIQACILLCMGLQGQNVTYVEEAMGIGGSVILSHLRETLKKFYDCIASSTRSILNAGTG